MGRSVTVTGTGTASAPYDVVTLQLGASARAANPSDATARATYALGAMREAVIAGGADESTLQTTQVSLNPVHDKWPAVSAYEASLSLAVRLTDLQRVGSVLVAAVQAGGDGARVDGITFSHVDAHALESAAREAAFSDARTKAEQYAGLTGQALGEVRHVVEGGVRGGTPVMARAVMAEAGAPPVVDGGGGAVVASVTVTWALGPAF